MVDDLRLVKFEEEAHAALVEPLTELLHSAYRPLAEKGMRYLATHQPPETTLKRLKKGDSFLGFLGDELASTITVVKGNQNESAKWYQTPQVYYFSQFAVKPSHQGKGIGARLMDFVEEYGTRQGATEMALDTSEHAQDLILTYTKRGYRFVEYTQWDDTNYRSVILSKLLRQFHLADQPERIFPNDQSIGVERADRNRVHDLTVARGQRRFGQR